MVYATSAYIMVKAIDAGVSTNRGFFFTYGTEGWDSIVANLMGLWELPFILGWLFWGMMNVIFVTMFAMWAWTTLDWRLAEAA